MHRIGLIALLIGLLFASVLVPIAQAGNLASLSWSQYDVDIQINIDGTLTVTELQVISFSGQSYHFGHRAIPQARGTIDNVKVSEGPQSYIQSESNQPYTFETNIKSNGDLDIVWYFPYTSNSTHKYTLQYTVRNGLLYYPDQRYDRLQWKAIPADRDFSIAASKIVVHAPNGAPIQFVGAASGDPAVGTISSDRLSATFESTRVIPARQGIEVRVDFQHGVVQGSPPAWQATYDFEEKFKPLVDLLSIGLGVLIAVGGTLLVVALWYTRGRDPQVGLAAEYVSEPPGDLPPGVVGTLVDERADMQDIIATVIDLARRGFITLEEQQTSGFMGIGTTRDFVFHRVANTDTTPLRKYEQLVLDNVIPNDERKLSDLKNKFYTHLSAINSAVYAEVVRERLFPMRPDQVRTRWGCGGIGLLALAIVGGILTTALLGGISGAVVIPFIGLGMVGVVISGAGSVMPVKTRKGTEAAAAWLAFKRYLSNLERYTKVQEATDQFDKYLPYAIAFGIERSWINRFARVESTPVPLWYFPYGWGYPHDQGVPTAMSRGGMNVPSVQGMSDGLAGSLQSMSAGLTSMLNSAASTFSSAPSSSGSHGGWSGGGFSGGGGGGGGSAGFG